MIEPKKKRRIDRDVLTPVPGWEDRPGVTPIPVEADGQTYMVYDELHVGEVHSLYRCAYIVNGRRRQGVFKIAKIDRDDDLTVRESETLAKISPELQAHFPVPPTTFVCLWEGAHRRASVTLYSPAYFSMAEIWATYLDKLQLADAAWMIHRMFESLVYAHNDGIVHGAVFPDVMLLDVATHKGLLTDWSYSVPRKTKLAAIRPRYEAWYPPEVFDKDPATTGTDIYLAARTVVYLLGGDAAKGIVPNGTPPEIKLILRECLTTSPVHRAGDAAEIREAFGEAFKKLFGKPQFRPFSMPARA